MPKETFVIPAARSWRSLRRALAVPLVLALAACGATAATDATPTPAVTGSVNPTAHASGNQTADPTPTTTASARASASATAQASASATAGQPAFDCSLPVRLAATVARAQITDLQVGAHDGYDRMVWTFGAGLPQMTVERATPPLTQDASGAPMRVQGSAFLRVVLHGGTVQLPAGGVSYSGAVSMTPHFARLVDLQSAGDFEAVSSWYVGLDGQACVRAFTLDTPSRLVIDVQR